MPLPSPDTDGSANAAAAPPTMVLPNRAL